MIRFLVKKIVTDPKLHFIESRVYKTDIDPIELYDYVDTESIESYLKLLKDNSIIVKPSRSGKDYVYKVII